MDVNITVEFGDDAKKLIAGFVNALSEAKAAPKKARAKAKAKAEKTEKTEAVVEPETPAPAETPAPVETPAPADTPAPAVKPPVISMEELRDAARAFIAKNGRDPMVALLGEHGATAVANTPTENYDALHAALVAGAAGAATEATDSLL